MTLQEPWNSFWVFQFFSICFHGSIETFFPIVNGSSEISPALKSLEPFIILNDALNTLFLIRTQIFSLLKIKQMMALIFDRTGPKNKWNYWKKPSIFFFLYRFPFFIFHDFFFFFWDFQFFFWEVLFSINFFFLL